MGIKKALAQLSIDRDLILKVKDVCIFFLRKGASKKFV